jgi:hypothetical protein
MLNDQTMKRWNEYDKRQSNYLLSVTAEIVQPIRRKMNKFAIRRRTADWIEFRGGLHSYL